MLITKASKEDKVILERVTYIHYLLYFLKNQENKIWALINSDNEINTIIPAYASEPSLRIRQTNIKA